MLSTIQWGNFSNFCVEADLPVCKLWASMNGTAPIQRTCSPQGVSISGYQLTAIGDLAVCALSILLLFVMMFRAHRKFAAVGRREMNIFLTFYFFLLLSQVVSVGNVVPTTLSPLLIPIACAVNVGFALSTLWVLMLTGFTGYQFVEDGGPLSFFGIFLSGLIVLGGVGVLCVDMVMNLFGSVLVAGSSATPYVSAYLFPAYFIFPLAAVLVYVSLETILVAKHLGEQKPLVNLYVALTFFILSQVFMFVLNSMVCEGLNKIVDGTAFATLCNTVGVVFVYRFWDSITEDEWDNIDDVFV